MDSFPLMNWVKSWTTLRQFERLTVSPLVIHLNTVREHCNLFDLQNIIIKLGIKGGSQTRKMCPSHVLLIKI